MKKLIYLKAELEKRHPGVEKEFFVGFQCGLVAGGYKGELLHDDTCAIITSSEYLSI